MITNRSASIMQRIVDRLDHRIKALTVARNLIASRLEESVAAKAESENSDTVEGR